jgi:phage-related baseplate assembly protein
MSPANRCVKKHAKARRRRYRTAQERLTRDCRQAQHAAKVLDVPRSTLQAWQADQDRRVCSF